MIAEISISSDCWSSQQLQSKVIFTICISTKDAISASSPAGPLPKLNYRNELWVEHDLENPELFTLIETTEISGDHHLFLVRIPLKYGQMDKYIYKQVLEAGQDEEDWVKLWRPGDTLQTPGIPVKLYRTRYLENDAKRQCINSPQESPQTDAEDSPSHGDICSQSCCTECVGSGYDVSHLINTIHFFARDPRLQPAIPGNLQEDVEPAIDQENIQVFGYITAPGGPQRLIQVELMNGAISLRELGEKYICGPWYDTSGQVLAEAVKPYTQGLVYYMLNGKWCLRANDASDFDDESSQESELM